MKKTLLAVSVLLLATLACNAVLPQTAPTPTMPTVSTLPPQTAEQTSLPLTEADVPRVSVEDAKLAFDNNEAVFVDVRGENYYAEEHVVGAISITLDKFEFEIETMPLYKNQWIITYCT